MANCNRPAAGRNGQWAQAGFPAVRDAPAIVMETGHLSKIILFRESINQPIISRKVLDILIFFYFIEAQRLHEVIREVGSKKAWSMGFGRRSVLLRLQSTTNR
jgi:hypothetical protein